MLFEASRPGGGGRVAVLTRNPTVTLLLERILDAWSFAVAGPDQPCEIALVERGVPAPAAAAQVIWLTPMPLTVEAHVELPLSLVELYHYLEQLFFPVPRRHIRLPVNQPLDLNVRGVWLVGRLLSISDRGARVDCPAALPKGERIILDFKLGSYPLRVSADVLYDIPAGDVAGREHPQAGLLFNPLKPALRAALRQFIELAFVERACSAAGVDANDPGLSWFALTRNPWAGLAE